MDSSILRHRLVASVAASAATVSLAPNRSDSGDVGPLNIIHAAVGAEARPSFGEGSSAATPTEISITAEVSVKWTAKHARRFQELLALCATEAASAEQEVELRKLQTLRRTTELAPDPEELMARWRRNRFLHDLREVLERNASFLSSASGTPRPRTARKTARA